MQLRTFCCKIIIRRVHAYICNSQYSTVCDGVSCPWYLHTPDSCDAISVLIRTFVHFHKAFSGFRKTLCPGISNTISLSIVLLQVNYSTTLLSFIPNIPAVFYCFAALFSVVFRCGHCKKLAPEFESAATRLKGTVTLAKVNTVGDGNDNFLISWLGSHYRNVLSSIQIRLYLQCL